MRNFTVPNASAATTSPPVGAAIVAGMCSSSSFMFSMLTLYFTGPNTAMSAASPLAGAAAGMWSCRYIFRALLLTRFISRFSHSDCDTLHCTCRQALLTIGPCYFTHPLDCPQETLWTLPLTLLLVVDVPVTPSLCLHLHPVFGMLLRRAAVLVSTLRGKEDLFFLGRLL